jgi:hypothetical protein
MRKLALISTLVGVCLLVACIVAAATMAGGPSAPSSKLRVDQSNLVTSPEGLGLSNGLYGQTFVPKATNLAQVDLLLTVNQVPAGGAACSVGLYGTITSTPIATASVSVAPPVPGELARMVSFRFDPVVPLARKTLYTLGWTGPSTLSWQLSFGDPYPAGQVVLYDGTPLNPAADFVFTTYTLKP